MAKSRIGRNDPCWCGSGKKFKKCHADRSTQSPYPYHELATLPSGSAGIAAFAWLKDADTVCRAFVTSLLAVPDDRKSDVIIQLIFDSFENHAIEPGYWDSLSAEIKSEAHERMLNWTDMRPIKSDALVPGITKFAAWTITRVIWF